MSIAQPTLEDVWQLFRETAAQMKESDRRWQETERFLKEQSKETDRRFQETECFLKEQSQTTERFLKEQSQTTERFLKEQSQATDRKLREVARDIGKLGNRLGDFVQEMVRPALVRLFQERNINVRQVLQNLTAYDEQRRMQSEADLVVLNTTEIVVVECKSQLSIDDVNDHIKRLDSFKIHFPQYTALHILGAVAAMVLPENVGQYAIRKGLYLLAQSGEIIVIQNDKEFIPKQW